MKELKAFFKTNIEKILNSEIISRDNSYYLKIGEYCISEVRILGKIIELLDRRKYKDLIIEDNTGRIIVRIWVEKYGLISDLDIGDYVDILGRIRIFREIRYIDPQIIVKVKDPNLIKIREKEIKLLEILLMKKAL